MCKTGKHIIAAVAAPFDKESDDKNNAGADKRGDCCNIDVALVVIRRN